MATRGEELLESHNKKARKIFHRVLAERGVDVRFQAEVIGVKPVSKGIDESDPGMSSLIISGKSKAQPSILFHECLWCTTAGAAPWLAQHTPFETSSEGFIQVRRTYQSKNHENVFAAGDCCHMVDNPRPKAGVFAVRAGPPLKDNLIAYLLKRPLRKHIPQTNFLGLISTGDKYAVASRGRLALEGRYLWTLKDKIDRRFMHMYQSFPTMLDAQDADNSARIAASRKGHDGFASFSAAVMRCGGCGAKVGATTVARVLNDVRKRSELKAAEHANGYLQESTSQLFDYDDAAVIILPPQGGGAQVQTIDFFRSFISDPFVFGKIAAGKYTWNSFKSRSVVHML